MTCAVSVVLMHVSRLPARSGCSYTMAFYMPGLEVALATGSDNDTASGMPVNASGLRRLSLLRSVPFLTNLFCTLRQDGVGQLHEDGHGGLHHEAC